MRNKKLKPYFEELNIEKSDMQGIISRGYNSLNSAVYLLLKINNAAAAKEYFNTLINKNKITSADKSAIIDVTTNGDPTTAVQLAFTYTGLFKLNLPQNVLSTFSRHFIEGMSYSGENVSNPVNERSNILGDTMNNAPKNWLWGNEAKPVDCLLMLFAEDDKQLLYLKNLIAPNPQSGIELVYTACTYQYQQEISKEHFGFQDGISQPIIKGLSQSANESNDDKLINPGEFILGYKNDYNNYSPSPFVDAKANHSHLLPLLPKYCDQKDLGKNGTYLVFRQIKQEVEKFWDYHYNKTKENGVTRIEKAVKLASKMIGRWPEGQPLATCPLGACSMDSDAINNFSYALQDKDGVNCPLGAHIRRTNPRDQVHTGRGQKDSLLLSRKHRMLRRGRIYGEPLVEDFDVEKMLDRLKNQWCNSIKPVDRGLHFICLVSDIERQFEFVQSVWANTSTFGNLCNEVDPIISPRPTKNQPHCHEFTTPQQNIRNRYKQVPEFTTVVGGAYFFMPGINALKYIMQNHP